MDFLASGRVKIKAIVAIDNLDAVKKLFQREVVFLPENTQLYSRQHHLGNLALANLRADYSRRRTRDIRLFFSAMRTKLSSKQSSSLFVFRLQ